MTFGERVFNRRRELGLEQQEIAKALDVSVSTVCKIESGRIRSTSKTAKKIAELLQLGEPTDPKYLTGNRNIDLAILEKRVSNAIFELEIVLDILRDMKGETHEESL